MTRNSFTIFLNKEKDAVKASTVDVAAERVAAKKVAAEKVAAGKHKLPWK